MYFISIINNLVLEGWLLSYLVAMHVSLVMGWFWELCFVALNRWHTVMAIGLGEYVSLESVLFIIFPFSYSILCYSDLLNNML